MLRRLLPFVGLLAACTPAPPAARGVTAVAIPATDAPPASSARAEESADCKLTTAEWGEQGEGPLRFSPDEPPFAFFDTGRVELTIGSTVPGIPTRVDERGVVLEGVTVPADVGLYVRRPLLFEELATPYGNTVLHWSGRTRDTSLVLTHHLKTHAGGFVALNRAVTCKDITLDRTEFDAVDDAILDVGEAGFLVVTSVAVATKSDGDPVVTLGVDEASEIVVVVEREGAHVRVVWRRAEEVIHGWVAADAVADEPAEELFADEFGAGGLGLSGIGGVSFWTCPRKLDLFAKRGERVWQVGSIAANTEVVMGVVNDGYRDVSLFVTRRIRAADDVTFLVRNDRLTDCSF